MAKRFGPDHSADSGKMRLLYVELDANNDSLKEGFRTLVAAMNRPSKLAPVQRQLTKAPVVDEAGASQPTLFDDEMEFESPPAQVEPSDSSEATASPRKRGQGPKRDRNASLALVPDLNFRPSDKDNLKKFFSSYKLDTGEEKVLVFAYYLTRVLTISPIGPNHIYTSFKEVNEKVPLDLAQTIRNVMKTKGWVNFTDIEDIRVTVAGENMVEHDLRERGPTAVLESRRE